MLTLPVAAGIALLIAGLGVALAAVWRSDRRLGLGIVHPAVAWVGLTALFFGLGSVILAVDGRPGPAAYTGGALLAFGVGLAASDALARRRAAQAPADSDDELLPTTAETRRPLVAALAALGLLAVAPTLLATGLPLLAPDITGARTELAGLPVQVFRIAVPAAAGVALLAALRAPRRRRWPAVLAIGAIGLLEVLLATRYLVAEFIAVLVLSVLVAGIRIPRRTLALVAAAGIVLFLGIQLARSSEAARGREVAFLAERTVSRLVLVQPRTIDALMTVIPAEQPHFDGLTWVRRLGPLVGRTDIPNLGYWIYPRVVPDPQPIPGYAAPGWLGEAWANFGWLGLSLFAFLGAATERFAAILAIRRRRFAPLVAPADAVAGALLVLFLARTHALGVAGLAVTGVLTIAWRLIVAPPAGLAGDLRRTLAWRT